MPLPPRIETAIAGACIAVALLDKLVQRGVIDRGDGLAVLKTAEAHAANLLPEAATIVRQLHAHMTSGS